MRLMLSGLYWGLPAETVKTINTARKVLMLRLSVSRICCELGSLLQFREEFLILISSVYYYRGLFFITSQHFPKSVQCARNPFTSEAKVIHVVGVSGVADHLKMITNTSVSALSSINEPPTYAFVPRVFLDKWASLHFWVRDLLRIYGNHWEAARIKTRIK